MLGGLYTTAITYLVGNFLTLAFTGLGNQIIHAWWLHNAVGLFITPLGLGIAYYLTPIAAQQPIYSHRLSEVNACSMGLKRASRCRRCALISEVEVLALPLG